MKPSIIDLFCCSCGMTILQVNMQDRPIQEQKITCPACKERTKIALLHTAFGGTFQMHLRDVDPKAQINHYPPHLVKYGKSRTYRK